jgi:ribosomal-protein-alanine N-acetyltransferase
MNILHTNRLQLSPVTLEDADFMFKLINCPGFLRFIGDRNVRTLEQAQTYIANMLENPDVTYWVIRKSKGNNPVGVVTLVNRDFLPAPDLGYALLPEFEGNGYAFEASQVWLAYQQKTHESVLAICQADNTASIKLLHKLNFKLEQYFEKDGHAMHQYRIRQ